MTGTHKGVCTGHKTKGHDLTSKCDNIAHHKEEEREKAVADRAKKLADSKEQSVARRDAQLEAEDKIDMAIKMRLGLINENPYEDDTPDETLNKNEGNMIDADGESIHWYRDTFGIPVFIKEKRADVSNMLYSLIGKTMRKRVNILRESHISFQSDEIDWSKWWTMPQLATAVTEHLYDEDIVGKERSDYFRKQPLQFNHDKLGWHESKHYHYEDFELERVLTPDEVQRLQIRYPNAKIQGTRIVKGRRMVPDAGFMFITNPETVMIYKHTGLEFWEAGGKNTILVPSDPIDYRMQMYVPTSKPLEVDAISDWQQEKRDKAEFKEKWVQQRKELEAKSSAMMEEAYKRSFVRTPSDALVTMSLEIYPEKDMKEIWSGRIGVEKYLSRTDMDSMIQHGFASVEGSITKKFKQEIARLGYEGAKEKGIDTIPDLQFGEKYMLVDSQNKRRVTDNKFALFSVLMHYHKRGKWKLFVIPHGKTGPDYFKELKERKLI